MAIRPLNSIAGFSTGDPAITVIQANADITTINLTANGLSNLGNVGNVKITGGTTGQVISTDGNGNLSFTTINASSNRAAPMPYLIPTGEAYIVNENFQGLYSQAITIDGELTVDGMLIEIVDTVASEDTQVLYDNNGIPTGNAGFTFSSYNGNLGVPGNINVTGSVIPNADDVYDLGRANARWRNGYFGGNTIYLDSATISVDANGFLVFTNEVGGTFTVEGTEQTSTTEIENGNSNVKVYANGNVATTVSGVANVFVVTTAGANLTGNLTAGGIKTNNLYYANGTAWDLGGNPGGSNTQIQFNSNGEFGASANFAFDTATNNLNLNANLVVSNGTITSSGNISAPYFLGNVQGNISGNIVVPGNNTAVIFNDSGNAGASDAFTFNKSSNLVTANSLSVTNDATISGNLSVNGNLIYVNVTELSIKDPIINLQTGANGAAPTSNSGKDVGSALNYYDTQARVAFMGWDTSNAEFAFGSQTSISSEVVTFTTLGNVRAQTFKGNVEATTISGSLTTASQANITTVGTLGSLAVTGNISAGNVNGGNLLNANYLVANSGCVSISGAAIVFDSGTGAGGIFNSLASNINIGLAANITLGSTTGTSNIRGELSVGGNANVTGNLSANLLTGTLTTAAQPNITSVGILSSLTVTGNAISNIAEANTTKTNSVVSKRNAIPVSTLTVIDSFSINDYRSAKYVISSQNDDGYESLEVLLIHNDINSYVTVYGAINDGGGNTISISTSVTSGNVELKATGLAGNTEVRLIGMYVPVI
jgi:hypothetical protein